MNTTSFKLSLIATFIALPAIAETTDLSTIEVSATSGNTLSEHNKSLTTSAMSTTTGLALSPKETPQSVSAITLTQLKEQSIHSLPEALKYTTGINVTRNGPRYSFYSRGFIMNQIEEDGMASMMPGTLLNSNSDPQSMSDLAIYDHIEVVRGATGLTQGTGEPGGTVNAVRKKPTTETQANVNASIDRFGSFRSTADLSGTLKEGVRGRLVAVGERSRSFKDNVDGSKRTIYGVLDFELGDNALLTVGGLYQNEHATPDVGGLPLGNGYDLGLKYDSFLGASWNKSISRKYNFFTELDYFFNNDWKFTNKVNYINSGYNQQYAFLADSSNSYTGVGTDELLPVSGRLSRMDNTGHQFSYQSNLTGKYNLFDRKHDLFITYSYSRENLHAKWRQFADSSAYNVHTFKGEIPYKDFNIGPYRYREFEDYSLTNHGVSLGSRFNITDNLHFLAGTRYTKWDSNYKDSYYGASGAETYEPNHKKRDRFIPYAGLTYDLNKTHSAYASYTSIFKPQLGAIDKEGKLLPPIIGNNYEIGLKSSWYDNKLNTSLALFKILQKNRTVSITKAMAQAMDPNATKGYSIPTGKVESRGFEAEISGALTDRWQMFTGYTFNLSKYRITESSNYIAGMNFSKHTPKHMLRLYTNYNLPFDENRWTIGGGLNYQSSTSSLMNIEQGGYTTWNANIQYALNKHITLGLIAKNIFDKRYYENHRTRVKGMNNFYGEPRNIVFNVDWKL